MKFVPQLAEDPFAWTILGIREVRFLGDYSDLSLEFFCISSEAASRNSKYGVKSFFLPLTALIYVKPGSIWREGVQISKNLKSGMTKSVAVNKMKLVSSSRARSALEVKDELSRSKNPFGTFLKHVNYLRYVGEEYTLYIPCSEILRFYLAPTQRYLKNIVTGGLMIMSVWS